MQKKLLRASVSSNVINISENVPFAKRVLVDNPGVEFDVVQFKALYEKETNLKLPGEYFTHWFRVPSRGKGWSFTNKMKFHSVCRMIEFIYEENDKLKLGNNGCYLRHAFI
jgi:hypothetical protein